MLAECALWESGGWERVMVTGRFTEQTCGRLLGEGRLCVLSHVRLGEQETCSAWMGAGFILSFIRGRKEGWAVLAGRGFLLVCFFIVVIIYFGC